MRVGVLPQCSEPRQQHIIRCLCIDEVGRVFEMAAESSTKLFLQSLANDTRTTKTDARKKLASKLDERAKCLKKMRNIRDRMRKLKAQLEAQEGNLAIIDMDAARLQRDVDNGIDENFDDDLPLRHPPAGNSGMDTM